MNDAPTLDSHDARRARMLHPSYSWCQRCGWPWKYAEGHTVWYEFDQCGGTRGCFPLCELCFRESSPDEVVHHYRKWAENANRELSLMGSQQRENVTAVVTAAVADKLGIP